MKSTKQDLLCTFGQYVMRKSMRKSIMYSLMTLFCSRMARKNYECHYNPTMVYLGSNEEDRYWVVGRQMNERVGGHDRTAAGVLGLKVPWSECPPACNECKYSPYGSVNVMTHVIHIALKERGWMGNLVRGTLEHITPGQDDKCLQNHIHYSNKVIKLIRLIRVCCLAFTKLYI